MLKTMTIFVETLLFYELLLVLLSYHLVKSSLIYQLLLHDPHEHESE
jgi:hypothetical protein